MTYPHDPTDLTLDEVREPRFHLARKNGYDPNEVERFVARAMAFLRSKAAGA